MKKILICLALALGMALTVTTPASAQQNGLQQVYVGAQSWSSIYIKFACGNAYNVPQGATWGEGRTYPQCGTYTYQAEPSDIWVGPGWCVTRNIAYNGAVYPDEKFIGGGAGGWFRIWTTSFGGNSYVNRLWSWYGSDCPQTGGARLGTIPQYT